MPDLDLPTVGGDDDTWGTKLNTALTELAAAVDTAVSTAGHALAVASNVETVARPLIPFVGVHKTGFELVDLTAPSGLAIDGGAIVAAVAGVNGTATIPLPVTLDRNLPFRITARMYHDGATSDGEAISFRVGRADDNQRGVTFLARCIPVAAVDFIGPVAGFNLGQVVPAGVYEGSVISDGLTEARATWRPRDLPIHGIYETSTEYDKRYIYSRGHNPVTATNYTGTQPTWEGVTEVVIETKSTTDKILSITVEQGELITALGDGTSRFFLEPTVATPDGSIPNVDGRILGRGYDGRNPKGVVYWAHPNASDPWGYAAGVGTDVTTLPVELSQALIDDGYLVVFCRGDSTSYVSAASSSWGAPAGRIPRRAMLDWVDRNFWTAHKHGVGLSMGLLDVLNQHRVYGDMASIVGIAGVANLQAAYLGSGGGQVFKPEIDLAYGTSTQAAIAPSDPTANPTAFTDIPILLNHGTADSIIPKAQHADAFQTAVDAVTGDVTVVAIAGGGHLDSTLFNGIDPQHVLDFIRAAS